MFKALQRNQKVSFCNNHISGKCVCVCLERLPQADGLPPIKLRDSDGR